MTIRRVLAVCILGLAVSACGATAQRLAEVGRPPAMSPIEDPSQLAGGGVTRIPMPAEEAFGPNETNSLWRPGARTFFGDPRASRPGDILTVNINIQDNARVQNATNRSRTSSENSRINNFLGAETSLANIFPNAIDPENLTRFGSNSAMQGSGSVDRREQINMAIAAIVTQRLSNGNLVIAGRQEVRINNEVRELLITGIVRPEDIAADNTIRHTQIAEARVSYGGRGHISDMQRPRVGQEIYDILWPF